MSVSMRIPHIPNRGGVVAGGTRPSSAPGSQWPCANNDPQVRPDSYDGSVGNHAQMSFSYGEHGSPHPAPEIAEVIAKAAVEVLLDRFPDVLLAVPADALEWRESTMLRGLSALPVKFTPAYVTGRAA